MRYKKIAAVMLSIVLLALYSSGAVNAALADAYTAASPSVRQEVWPQKVREGTYDLILNGGFETVSNDGTPTGWSVSHPTAVEGAEYMTAAGDAQEGENFAVISGKKGGSIYLSQMLFTLLPGQTYAFSGHMRQISGTAKPMLYIVCQKPSGKSYSPVKTFYYSIEKLGKSWQEVSYSFTAPAETARVIFAIRLDGEAEIHSDNTHLIGKAPESVALEAEFRDMLKAEEALRASLEKECSNAGDGSTVEGQPENILTNGTFGDGAKGWRCADSFSDYVSLAKGASYDGSDCIRLYVPDGLVHPFYYQIQKLVGGAEYEVSFWCKNVSGGKAAIKLEYYTDRNLPGAVSCGEKYVSSSTVDGQWHFVKAKVYPAANVEEATIFARLMKDAAVGKAEVYMDDVRIRMTRPPSPLVFDTGSVFFYSDQTEGVLSSAVNLQYFPRLTDAKIDFTILDDRKNVLWERTGLRSADGKTSAVFPLSLLKEKERPYIAKATLYDTDGSVMEIKTQQIYMYDRPAFMGRDGVYKKNGNEAFYPTYAYHVSTSQYKKVAEAGINLVQMGAFGDADEAVACLDAAQEAGIMGFIALYNDMKPAGSADNITRTIAILSDERVKNHPALFGYGIMDEVFLTLNNPELDMENSYRLIRMLDKNRPIMAMEAVRTYYKETGKYVDILCIDPYSAAADRNASVSTEEARQAVGYEKPVYALLETYYTTNGRWPSPEDGRNNNWQALIAGAGAVGYYSIRDADTDPQTGKYTVPIWDARDGGALWNALCTFGDKEKQIAYDHFVFDKTPAFNEYRGGDYWYSAWVDGQDIYMVVLGMKKSGTQEVSIPLTSFAGDIRVGEYTAELIAGRTAESFTGSGSLTLTVNGVEALFYKITPTKETDFSALGVSCFEDMEAYSWARQQVAFLNSLGILEGQNEWRYAPGEGITRRELGEILARVTGSAVDGGTEGLDGLISRKEAVDMAAEGMRDILGERDVLYAKADMAAALHGTRLSGNTEEGNAVTRAEAAILIYKAWEWIQTPDKANAFLGLSTSVAAQLTEAMTENVGIIDGTSWYVLDGDCIFLQNMSDVVAMIRVPRGGQYAAALFGVQTSAVVLSGQETIVTVPPRGYAAVRITETQTAGLYIGNVSESLPQKNVTYTVYGYAGIYTDRNGLPELLRLYMEGERVQLTEGVYARCFLWDDAMRPLE